MGGGVDRFLALLGLSKVEARALKAGDLPRTRFLSGATDKLLERCCGFSPPPALPAMAATGILLLGFFNFNKFINTYKEYICSYVG